MKKRNIDYRNDREDKWYDWKGVKRPERTSHGITEEDIDEILAENLKGHKCVWTQKGSEIFCEEGEYTHGKRIGANLQLKGTGKKGEPLLGPVGAILRDNANGG